MTAVRMRRRIALACFAGALLLACADAPATVSQITPTALLTEPPPGALILDVRTPQEFASGHVPGAVNVPHDELAARVEAGGFDRDRPIVVYCESGGRAGRAATTLVDAGFDDVRHLEGDMRAWRTAGRPTEEP